MKSDGDKYTLTISNAQETDSGEYKISAASAGGLLSCTASLLVTSKIETRSFSLLHCGFLPLRGLSRKFYLGLDNPGAC